MFLVPTPELLLELFNRFRKQVICALVVIALGCSYGIWQGIQYADQQHKDDVAITTAQCWSTFDGRLVIRALISGGIHAPITKEEVRLINADATFSALIRISQRDSKAFVKTALHVVPLPKCKGHNPNPVLPGLLKAAGEPINLKQ